MSQTGKHGGKGERAQGEDPNVAKQVQGHFVEEGRATFGSKGTGCVWTPCLLLGLMILFSCRPNADSQICWTCFLLNDHSSKILPAPPPRNIFLDFLFFFQYILGPFCVVKAVCTLSVLKPVTYTFWGKACLSLSFVSFFFFFRKKVICRENARTLPNYICFCLVLVPKTRRQRRNLSGLYNP